MYSSDPVAGTNATALQIANIRKDMILGARVFGTETDAATITFDMSNVAKGVLRSVTLGGNRTLAVSNVVTNQGFVINLKQDATGSRTVTWWAGILWAGGVAPTLSTGANKYDIFAFIYDGTNYYGSIVGQAYA